MATFDRNNLPTDTPIEWVDEVNRGIDQLRARKVSRIRFETPSHLEFCAHWIEIYLQTFIRRGLSLIDGGVAEIKAGRTLVAAFCARALLEDSALLWSFIRRTDALLDSGNEIELDDYIFSKALASKLPKHIQRWGEEYKATNILTAIDKVTVEHPNIRPMYDEREATRRCARNLAPIGSFAERPLWNILKSLAAPNLESDRSKANAAECLIGMHNGALKTVSYNSKRCTFRGSSISVHLPDRSRQWLEYAREHRANLPNVNSFCRGPRNVRCSTHCMRETCS